jgi:hypothetical protein
MNSDFATECSMVTIMDQIKEGMSEATLEDLLQLDERIVAAEGILRGLKSERQRMFESVQNQRIAAREKEVDRLAALRAADDGMRTADGDPKSGERFDQCD